MYESTGHKEMTIGQLQEYMKCLIELTPKQMQIIDLLLRKCIEAEGDDVHEDVEELQDHVREALKIIAIPNADEMDAILASRSEH